VAPRTGMRAGLRLVIGWIAAYALALNALLVAMGLPHHGNTGAASSFILCITDDGSSAPPADGGPGGTADCDFHCTLARSVGANLVLALSAATVDIEFDVAMIRWVVADDPAPSRIRSVHERSRGPPLAA
jgi:DUF2946 family protein